MKKIKENLSMIGFYLFIVIIIFCCSINASENDEYVTAQKTNNDSYILS